MKLYRFSPIKSREGLLEAIRHIHMECHKLCQQSFGEYLPVAGNIGVFCHHQGEFAYLTGLRQEMTDLADTINDKYFKLHEPIVIPEEGGIPEATYTYLYIRQPDPYRSQVGDIDFVMEQLRYNATKQRLVESKSIAGARLFPRSDLDMIELYDPDVDVLAYVSKNNLTDKAKIRKENK